MVDLRGFRVSAAQIRRTFPPFRVHVRASRRRCPNDPLRSSTNMKKEATAWVVSFFVWKGNHIWIALLRGGAFCLPGVHCLLTLVSICFPPESFYMTSTALQRIWLCKYNRSKPTLQHYSYCHNEMYYKMFRNIKPSWALTARIF